MRTDKIGIYVHVPFCVKKCNYCDFCSFPLNSFSDEERSAYVSALCSEIDGYKGLRIEADTVFIGGGTPSLLSGQDIYKIREHIEAAFSISSAAEFTLEVNPKTLTEENLSAYINAGVNRISIGLQTIHKNELKKLGRIHSYNDFLDTYNLAREFGINNINVDLMYGIPNQTIASFEETLKTVLSLSPEHISLYGLILEENTPLFKIKDSLVLPTEDTECDMYDLATNMLRGHGYSHYEISNYAKAGRECRHNLKYWRAEEYIGFGLSAHSYFDGKRFANTSSFCDYLNEPISILGSDTLTFEDKRSEYAMLRLRLSEGFSPSEYLRLFGEDFLHSRASALKRFHEGGYINLGDDRISLTERGFYVSNSIISELM